jgi:hypothetical protein
LPKLALLFIWNNSYELRGENASLQWPLDILFTHFLGVCDRGRRDRRPHNHAGTQSSLVIKVEIACNRFASEWNIVTPIEARGVSRISTSFSKASFKFGDQVRRAELCRITLRSD